LNSMQSYSSNWNSNLTFKFWLFFLSFWIVLKNCLSILIMLITTNYTNIYIRLSCNRYINIKLITIEQTLNWVHITQQPNSSTFINTINHYSNYHFPAYLFQLTTTSTAKSTLFPFPHSNDMYFLQPYCLS